MQLLPLSAVRLVVALSLLFALAAQSVRTSTPTGLHVPGTRNATPWIASSGRWVAVAWGATLRDKTDVLVAVSRDGGATFGAPVRVNAIAGDARLGGELPPRVALRSIEGGPPTVVVLWTAKGAGTEVRLSRSRDGGATFEPPVALQAAGAAGDRGWPSLALDAHGVPHAAWLDHRGLALDRGRHAHQSGQHHAASGDETSAAMAMAQGSALYTASGDRPGERVVTTSVCYCCKTALATAPEGAIYVAWRHVFPGSVRDIALAVSRDAGLTFSAPSRVSADGWAVNGCPDNGPSLAVGADGQVHVVWPTLLEGEQPALFYASSKDGQHFTPRLRVPMREGATPSHPQIAMAGGGRLAIAWDEAAAGRREALVRALLPGTSPSWGPVVTLGEGTYPVLAPGTDGDVVAAWTAPAPIGIGVRRIGLR